MYQDAQIRRPAVSVAAGSTDALLAAAEPGRRLYLLSVHALATAATALTVNSKPDGAAGVAVGPTFTAADGRPTLDLAYNPRGWLRSRYGEGLSVTTGAGQATQIAAVVASASALDAYYDEAPDAAELLLEDRTPILTESA